MFFGWVYTPLGTQSAEPSAFGQNHPERVSFSSKQYKNTVYQNLNTMQHVGGEGRVQTRQAPTPSAAPSQDNNTTIGPLEPAKRVITQTALNTIEE